MKIILGLYCCLFLINGIAAQADDLPNFAELGKCYAKVLMPNSVDTETVTFPVYIGENSNSDYVKTISLTLINERTGWEEKNRPEMKERVWCLVKIDPVVEEIVVVKDTTNIKDFVLETFDLNHYNADGGYTEWREIICFGDINEELVRNIEIELKMNGYYSQEISGKFTSDVKQSLTKYQRNNNLPVGNLDLETLEHLGVFNF